jgi:phospholipid/cholesterol/gamma-HCH transport system permease protein
MITRDPEYYPPPSSAVEALGRQVTLQCRGAGRALIMLANAILALRHVFAPRARREVMFQLFVVGIKSLGVTTVVAAFTGMILALQTGIELRRFGQEVNIGTAVMISMLREMGPFMTALILAASVGSAMAAQLGTMTVSDEIAALEVMSIDPVRFLVMPRLVALAIMTPLLAVYSCVMGLVGGGIIGMTQLDVSWTAYFQNATRYAENKDLYVGLFKAFLFGVVITTVACHQGFTATNGAVGVGNATRRTVVISFLTILILGYFVTRLFFV